MLQNHGDLAGRAGDPRAAVTATREATAVYAQLIKEHPAVARYARERIYASFTRAIYENGRGDGRIWVPSLGDDAAAETTLREVLPAIERLAEQDSNDTGAQIGRAVVLTSLGLAVAARSPGGAVELYDRALVAYDHVPPSFRTTPAGRESEFLIHCAEADALATLGRPDDAWARLRRGLELAEASHTPVCKLLGGRALRRIGDREGAAALLDAVVAALRPRLDEPELTVRIGLTEALGELAEVRPEQRCALVRDALAVWRSRPIETSYWRDREAALMAQVASGCPSR